MSPVDDTFLSASLDSTVRLWDLRTNACQGLIRRTGRASVAYDAQGLIFAVATSNNAVKLYDLRSFEKVRLCVSCVCRVRVCRVCRVWSVGSPPGHSRPQGPFATFFVDHHTALQWSGIKFSNDGKYILLPTTDSPIFLIDAFTGKKVRPPPSLHARWNLTDSACGCVTSSETNVHRPYQRSSFRVGGLVLSRRTIRALRFAFLALTRHVGCIHLLLLLLLLYQVAKMATCTCGTR
jgi:WD40 repeat protein